MTTNNTNKALLDVFGRRAFAPRAKRKRAPDDLVNARERHVVLSDLFYSQMEADTTPLAVHLREFASKAAQLATIIGNAFGDTLRPIANKVHAVSRVRTSADTAQAKHSLACISATFAELQTLHFPKYDASLAVAPFPDHVIEAIRVLLGKLLSVERATKVMVRARRGNTPEDEQFVHGLWILTWLPRAAGVDLSNYGKDYWLVFQFHEALRRGNPGGFSGSGRFTKRLPKL